MKIFAHGSFGIFGRLVFYIAIILVAILTGHNIIFAAPPNEIPRVFQITQQHWFIRLQHVEHSAVTAHMRVPPGHKGAPTRRANWVLAVGIAESYRVTLYNSV